MRTIPLAMLRDAAADAQDHAMLALAIAADARTADWPAVVITDLWRIGTQGAASPVDLAKLKTCFAQLEAAAHA